MVKELIAILAMHYRISGTCGRENISCRVKINYLATQFFVFISALDTVRDSPSLSTFISFYFTCHCTR